MNNMISTLIGAFIAIMLVFNGTLSQETGNYTASVIIHGVGLVSIFLVILFSRTKFKLGKGIPLYLYSAGAIGVFTVLTNNLSFSKLGISITLALILLGQSLASIIIDHFGLLGMKRLPYENKKTVGLFFIGAGIVIMALF